MRNLYTGLPNGMLWVGDPRVGTPSADCVGLLAPAALEYPGQLLRAYVTDGPTGLSVSENGTITYSGPPSTIRFDLYVNGFLVGNISYRLSSSGAVSAIGGGGVSGDPHKKKPKKTLLILDTDTEYLDNIENAPEWSTLPEESKKEYGYNRKVNPLKKRIVYLIRRK